MPEQKKPPNLRTEEHICEACATCKYGRGAHCQKFGHRVNLIQICDDYEPLPVWTRIQEEEEKRPPNLRAAYAGDCCSNCQHCRMYHSPDRFRCLKYDREVERLQICDEYERPLMKGEEGWV